jgi:diguanylate cyclase (GGDEF)-like protein
VAGLMFLDLDKFKIVNDTFGHSCGDKLLKQVASRLKQCVRESDIVARLGGDEFTILLKNIESQNDIESLAELRITQ